jgi:PQQ-dependent dehydrogenase (methanol/ethanol family)
MQNQLPVRSTPFSFSMWKCAIALLCCAFSIEPLFAQELDWSNYGNDVSNSRFQSIDQINPSNVSQLKPAWTFHTGFLSDPAMSMEMTPLVINGVMYISTGDDAVFALNPTTGKQIWEYNPASDMPALNTISICCNRDNRGVAYGMGMIFDARLDSSLVALNAKTGAVVWKTAVDLISNGSAMTLAPLYVGASSGTQPEVIVGVTGGEYGIRGHLDAYNPATGKLLWRFWTTEPATWAGNTYLHGGASIWGTPTFDPTLNMVYFATGNAFPWNWTGNRAGTNLFATSMVAIDATSGELQWFHQYAHHDMWDFDGPQPTLLFSWNGIPAIEHTSKTGYMFILDRASGESLFPYAEVPIPPTPANAAFQHPWPTQPVSSIESLVAHVADPSSLIPGAVAVPQWTTVGPELQVFQPYASGGMEWPPAAYSPRTHMIYSHAKYSPSNTGVINNPATNTFCPTGINGTTKVATCDSLRSAIPLLGVKHGVYGAINTLTGKIAWTIPVTTTTPGSGVTVAGDLVFFGDSTGLFYAASAATGEILWVFDSWTVPNATGGNASAAIYEINGVEYVVYGFGGEPGQSFALGDAVIAFALPSAVTAAAAKAKAK